MASRRCTPPSPVALRKRSRRSSYAANSSNPDQPLLVPLNASYGTEYRIPVKGRALAISSRGRIVAGSLSAADETTGDADFIWDAKHGVRSLRAVLASQGVNIPIGTRISAITDMSHDARVFVGSAKSASDGMDVIFRAILRSDAFD